MVKTALITGAAKRIGKEIATYLAHQGWDIVIHCRTSVSEAETLISDLNKDTNITAVAVQADLQNRDEVKDLIKKSSDQLGKPIALLVNNASIFEDDTIDTLNDDSWDMHMDVNLFAPISLSQQFYKQFADSRPQQQGNIINIIDHRVWKLNPTFMSYTASKAGLWTMTQTMAQAMAPKVRVNAIGPGPVLASIHQTDDTFASEASNVPLGHGPTPKEIAKTVEYITTAASMTGQMIALDGGQHLAWQTPDIPV